jgi:histidinol-phosphate aminotransferase
MQQCVSKTLPQREWLAAQLRSIGVVMAPSATNFLFLNLQRPNGPVAEALLTRGVVVKPWKEMGYENFIRVSVASVDDNALFLQAFSEAMRALA